VDGIFLSFRFRSLTGLPHLPQNTTPTLQPLIAKTPTKTNQAFLISDYGLQGHQTHPRDSHLTFAVVWDPETGLEAYSGCDLMCLRPISDEYDFPESIYSESQVDDESVVFCNADEPFSVSGRPMPISLTSNILDVGLQSSSKVSLISSIKSSRFHISCDVRPTLPPRFFLRQRSPKSTLNPPSTRVQAPNGHLQLYGTLRQDCRLSVRVNYPNLSLQQSTANGLRFPPLPLPQTLSIIVMGISTTSSVVSTFEFYQNLALTVPLRHLLLKDTSMNHISPASIHSMNACFLNLVFIRFHSLPQRKATIHPALLP
jgi:hypothetical protein